MFSATVSGGAEKVPTSDSEQTLLLVDDHCQLHKRPDPKATPHPGDRFRCMTGAEIQVTGAVIAVTKDGRETRCLYVNRIDKDGVRRGALSLATLKFQITKAEILVTGIDLDSWTNALHRPASEVFRTQEVTISKATSVDNSKVDLSPPANDRLKT